MASIYNVTGVNATDVLDNFTDATTTVKSRGAEGSSDLKLYTEFWVASFINEYRMRFLCGIGLPCNMAVFRTIFVMKPFTTTSFYVAFLAVVDTLALTLTFLALEIKNPFGDLGCKFLLFFGNFCLLYANWVLVLMTLERFVAVWFPLKVSRISTMAKAKVTLAVTAVLLLGCNLHILWTFRELRSSNGEMDCLPTEEHGPFIANVWPWLDGLVYTIVPCYLVIVANGLIIYSLRRATTAQKTMRESGVPNMTYHQTQLTVMLVSVSVAFVCFLLPGTIFHIVEPYRDYKQNALQQAQDYLVHQIMFFLSECNHALNFFFFFLGGKRFRQVFLAFICCREKPQKKKKAPTTYVSQLSVTTPSSSHLSVSSSK